MLHIYMTSYIKYSIFQWDYSAKNEKQLSYIKHNTSPRWDEAKASRSFFHPLMCCIINAIHSLDPDEIYCLSFAFDCCHTCNNVVVWCGVSQSLPDDLSVSIYDVIFFFFIFVLFDFVTLLLEDAHQHQLYRISDSIFCLYQGNAIL